MSVAIATMGKFWPAFGGGGPPQIIVDDGGGSGIGTIYEKKKPVIHVTGVSENGQVRRKIKIEVTSVTEN